MPLYQFQSGSILDEVAILTNESGGTRAYLHAAAGTRPDQLLQIQTSIEHLGWKAVPIVHDGKPVLEVRGFKKHAAALKTLRDNGWTQGEPATTALDGDVRTSKQKLENATLRAAGLSYNVGDTAYLWYTVQKFLDHRLEATATRMGNFFNGLDIAGGIGYAMGSLALTKYGSRDQSQNTIQEASRKVQNYLRREGCAVNDQSALRKVVKDPKRNFWGQLDHTFAKYPSETLNSVYVGVGAVLSAAAFYRTITAFNAGDRETAIEEAWDVGLGTITAASALTGLLVKEKKIEDDERRKGLGRVLDWIQEKPLRATGFGYMVATLFHANSTRLKYKKNDPVVRKSIIGRAIFVGANVVAEILMALSSKGHGTGVKPDESVDQTVIAATAESLLHYPEHERLRLIDQLAGYMASPEVLGGKVDDIATQLRNYVDALKNNPWVQTPLVAANDGPTTMAPAPAAPQQPTVANDNEHHVNDNVKPGTEVSTVRNAQMLAQQQMEIVKSPW